MVRFANRSLREPGSQGMARLANDTGRCAALPVAKNAVKWFSSAAFARTKIVFTSYAGKLAKQAGEL